MGAIGLRGKAIAPMGRSYMAFPDIGNGLTPTIAAGANPDDRVMTIPASSPRIGHAALRKGRVSLAGHAYHVTGSTAQRLPVFADFRLGSIAAQAFDVACRSGGAELLAWVLMPDHAHWLLQLGDGGDLPDVVNRMKSASARHVNRARNQHGVLWARAFHDHAIRSEESLEQVAAYIIANPVRAGLVARIGDYPFWNTVWL